MQETHTPTTPAPALTYRDYEPIHHELYAPFSVNGKEFTEIKVDFMAINSEALSSINSEHRTRKATNPSYNDDSLPLLMVAKMNGIVLEDLKSKLSALDSMILNSEMDAFFIWLGSRKERGAARDTTTADQSLATPIQTAPSEGQ